MLRFERIDLRAAELYPPQHFEALRRFEKIGGLHDAGPGRKQAQALFGELPQRGVEFRMMPVVRGKQRDDGAGIKKNVSRAAWLSGPRPCVRMPPVFPWVFRF